MSTDPIANDDVVIVAHPSLSRTDHEHGRIPPPPSTTTIIRDNDGDGNATASVDGEDESDERQRTIELIGGGDPVPPPRPDPPFVAIAPNPGEEEEGRRERPRRRRVVVDDDDDDGNDATTTTTAAASDNVGTRPKLTNVSLLSSAVAYATLERCLLGVNGGTTTGADDEGIHDEDDDGRGEDDGMARGKGRRRRRRRRGGGTVNYSKLCRPGHVIDVLELRRLSSRGVPDEPPSPPCRRHSSGRRERDDVDSEDDRDDACDAASAAVRSHPASGNPHRSYRPLVWRVLLGYLPPQTDMWNEVLERDRKLYDALVNEFFDGTCPRPHDLLSDANDENGYGEGSDMANELHRRRTGGDNSPDAPFSIDDVDDHDVRSGIDYDDVDSPPPPPPPSPRLTPGLLSARMQQEWVRGENANENGGAPSAFDAQRNDIYNAGGGGYVAKCDGGTGPPRRRERLSPMCAMNTPRNSSNKGTAYRRGRGMGGDDGDRGDAPKTTTTTTTTPIEPPASSSYSDGRNGGYNLPYPLLLDVNDNDDDGANAIETSDTPDSSPGSARLRRSVSITRASSGDDPGGEYAEGVELCRRGSRDANDDDDDNYGAISPKTNGGGDRRSETDEEENALLLDEIRKDVIRTHPDLRFFLEPREDLGQKRYAALERILFVWAKLNKGVRYVQGMNEIVGTLYFVLAHDSNEDWSNEAEADTYFLFNALMVEMRDVFVPDLDEADTGIHGRISNMITLLSLHDPEVRCHLDSVGIDPSFYSVRWLTTLLSREFLLPDTIRLWDSMFASTHKDNFLRYVSVTMVMVIRDMLLMGDFSACLRLLQAYPPTNLDRLLESSRALWIYESQITLACHKGGISLGHALRSIKPPPAIVMAYGLRGGEAPLIREQVRQAGERGLAVARVAANGASTTVASAGRSFFGSAMSFWRGEPVDGQGRKEVRRSKSNSSNDG